MVSHDPKTHRTVGGICKSSIEASPFSKHIGEYVLNDMDRTVGEVGNSSKEKPRKGFKMMMKSSLNMRSFI